jgi:putative redox protein
MTHRVRARWLGDYQTEINIREVHILHGDETPQYGGEDTGPMPTDLLLAAVASCMCLAVSHAARKHNIALNELSVGVSAAKDEHAFRFGSIELVIEADLPQAELEPLVQRATGYCFVSNTLRKSCPVRTTAHSTLTSEQIDDG